VIGVAPVARPAPGTHDAEWTESRPRVDAELPNPDGESQHPGQLGFRPSTLRTFSSARCARDRSTAAAAKPPRSGVGIPGIDEGMRQQDRGLSGRIRVWQRDPGPWRVSLSWMSGPAGPPTNREASLAPRRQETVSETAGPEFPTGSRTKKPSSTLCQWSSSTIRDINQIRGRNPMSPRHRELHTTDSHPGSDVTRPGFNPLQHHTHVQHSCRCIHVDR
jgi:hypothetical protein